MSRVRKLIEKIRARPVEADYREVERLLAYFGWQKDRQGSTHVTFVKDGEPAIITVPLKNGKVKSPYLRMICERLGLDELDLDALGG